MSVQRTGVQFGFEVHTTGVLQLNSFGCFSLRVVDSWFKN